MTLFRILASSFILRVKWYRLGTSTPSWKLVVGEVLIGAERLWSIVLVVLVIDSSVLGFGLLIFRFNLFDHPV